jgi:MOSC domain-containing protein YiiM
MSSAGKMTIVSLNVGLPRMQTFGDKDFSTGICKRPVDGPVLMTATGFEGDGIADTIHHGGPDKAVCVYSAEHSAYWARELGAALPVAAFGENLTVQGLDESKVHVGDRFRIGSALAEVSQPRTPCLTLAARLGRADLPRLVIESGYTGLYLRVLEVGMVQGGDELVFVSRADPSVSVADANRIRHRDHGDLAGAEQLLQVQALSKSWRESLEKRVRSAQPDG